MSRGHALTLKEFAENLRLSDNRREADFGLEILNLCDIEAEVQEPYYQICGDLKYLSPDDLKDKPIKAVEWIGERLSTLEEIEEQLKKADRSGDADDAVKELLDTFENFEAIMRNHGGWAWGDLRDALFALIDRADRAPKDLEYDL